MSVMSQAYSTHPQFEQLPIATEVRYDPASASQDLRGLVIMALDQLLVEASHHNGKIDPETLLITTQTVPLGKHPRIRAQVSLLVPVRADLDMLRAVALSLHEQEKQR